MRHNKQLAKWFSLFFARQTSFLLLFIIFNALMPSYLVEVAGAQESFTKNFEQVSLPDEIDPLYGEAVAYKAKTKAKGKMVVRVDLGSLIPNFRAKEAVVVPYDEEKWYEAIHVKITGKTLSVELPRNRDILVALNLGEVARNNYYVINQLTALKSTLPRGLQPKICSQILCASEGFNADKLAEKIPEIKELTIDLDNALPPILVGPIGMPASICDECLEKRGFNLLPCLIWGCGDITRPPFARKVRIRKNIYSFSANPEDLPITSLKNGVAAMRARNASDPTSWAYQARMHAINSGAAAALQDQCQHRQFFFFSWHRMYIYYFERILRKASGDPKLNLPYWNYTDVDAQRVIPEVFRLPADVASNALYNGTRNVAYNGGAGLPASDVQYNSGFSLTNFTSTTSGVPTFGGGTVSAPQHFPSPGRSGQIEMSPHNNVHNDIGGDMATGESPRDPIFWLHHANIDRLWKKWLTLGGGRSNPTGNNTWMNQTFTFFDENGNQVSLTG